MLVSTQATEIADRDRFMKRLQQALAFDMGQEPWDGRGVLDLFGQAPAQTRGKNIPEGKDGAWTFWLAPLLCSLPAVQQPWSRLGGARSEAYSIWPPVACYATGWTGQPWSDASTKLEAMPPSRGFVVVLGSQLVEAQSALDDGGIDVVRVEFDAAADAACPCSKIHPAMESVCRW
jgi:hypothetical protein